MEVLRSGQAEAVYGSRYLRPARPLPWNRFRLAVAAVNFLVWLLYRRRLTDEATCYKALPTELFRALDLRADRFELCAEITAKLCRLGVEIREVPIGYQPRSVAEGKKIGWRDAGATVWALLRWRFARLPATAGKATVSPNGGVPARLPCGGGGGVEFWPCYSRRTPEGRNSQGLTSPE